MKSVLALILVIASTPAFATSMQPIECSKGKLGHDNYVGITLLAGTARIQMHETTLEAAHNETVSAGATLAILDKKVSGASEGEEIKPTVNALFVLDWPAKKLIATLIVDGTTILAAQTLSCK